MGIRIQNSSIQKHPNKEGEIIFKRLKNVDDIWVEEVEDIVGVAVNYFENLF